MKIVLLLIASIFAADNGKCPNADQYCLNCTSTTCTSCSFAYLSAGQCIKPTDTIANCIDYTANKVCTDCDKGYKLSANACVKIDIANCLAVDTNGLCIVCDSAKKPSTDGKTCSTTACTDTNCSYCMISSGVELCGICKSGYAMDISTNSCVAEKVANCAVQSGSTC